MYEETIKTLQQMLMDGEAALQKSKQEHQEWQEEHGHQCKIIKMILIIWLVGEMSLGSSLFLVLSLWGL